jgi:cold shock CspA family protein
MKRESASENAEPKKFDLEKHAPRKHVGLIRQVLPEKKIGFISAEDFREDVFFHFNDFEPKKKDQVPLEEMPVEFELDHEHRRETGKLRVLVFRPTKRPIGRVLEPRDAPHLQPRHHPRSLRRKPGWRKE